MSIVLSITMFAENAEKTGNNTFKIQMAEFVLFTRNNSSLNSCKNSQFEMAQQNS